MSPQAAAPHGTAAPAWHSGRLALDPELVHVQTRPLRGLAVRLCLCGNPTGHSLLLSGLLDGAPQQTGPGGQATSAQLPGPQPDWTPQQDSLSSAFGALTVRVPSLLGM